MSSKENHDKKPPKAFDICYLKNLFELATKENPNIEEDLCLINKVINV